MISWSKCRPLKSPSIFVCARQLCRSTDLPTTMLCPSSSHQSRRQDDALSRRRLLGAVRMPAMRQGLPAASSARRRAGVRQMRPGERADLSLAVGAHREAPCCSGPAPHCPDLPRHADAGECASEPGGGKAGERRECASPQSDRSARVARRQSEQGRDLTWRRSLRVSAFAVLSAVLRKQSQGRGVR
jgi:hypothetical protein